MSSIKGHRFQPFQKSQGSQIPKSMVTSANHSSRTSYLRSSPLLDYLGYRFHIKHSIMICVSCGCGVLPGDALGHVKNQHNISISREQQMLWDQTVTEWNVTNERSLPRPQDTQPVELLKIHANAYCCNCCEYAALTVGSFSKHWSLKHRSVGLRPSERYHDGSVQTFYTHVPCTYFEVDMPISKSSTLFDVYMKKEVPSYTPFNMTIPSSVREIPPLLNSTRWHEHLADYILDKEKRRVLFTLAHPTNYTKCSLWKLVWNYLGAVANIAKDTSMRVRCLLTEYPRYVKRSNYFDFYNPLL